MSWSGGCEVEGRAVQSASTPSAAGTATTEAGKSEGHSPASPANKD